MSDSTLRAQLKNIMSGITGVGKVHDYERFTADTAKFLSFFKDETSKKIFGWEMTREGVKHERITQKIKATHSFVIKGYYGLKDDAATEKTFNAVVDLIGQAFIDTKIPGSQGHSLPQVSTIGARSFGGVLCHYAEIRLDVSEIVEVTPEAGVADLLTVGLDYYLKPGDNNGDAADTVTLNQ